MKLLRYPKTMLLVACLLAAGLLFTFSSGHRKVDFNTQIKPLINKRCISCHGGVKAKGNFSLLFREDALGPTKSGKPAIIPGDPDHSDLIRRISSNDPEERMPYKHEPLSKEEIDLFRDWIREGAPWGRHWAYVPVSLPPVPEKKDPFILNEIDAFVLNKLQEHDLKPSPEADKETLLRRVSLDLIGMPAPDSIARDFLADKSEAAYGRLVDRLMSTHFFGEKWATMWLDLARYADTRGYEADRGRSIWRYRDWVIDAFNSDKPYDVFLTEQMAGDLLPHPTDAQYIATGFHRNTMTNDEGGTDNEEFRTAAVLDRVNTTWTAVLGTSFACVQCHSHPYDPFRHEDYYKFMAFFNNSRDEDTQAEYPLLRQYQSADSAQLADLRAWLQQQVSDSAADEWVRFLKTWQPTINSLQCDQFKNAALVSSWYAGIRNMGSCHLASVALKDRTELTYRFITYKPGGVWEIRLDSLQGKLLKRIPLENTQGSWSLTSTEIPATAGVHDLYFTYHNPGLHDPNETGVMFEWFRFADPFPGKGRPGYEKAHAAYWSLMRAEPRTVSSILIENNADQFRKSYVFERGNWRVKGAQVTPAVPASLNPFPAGAPRNRLGLAEWLTDTLNPLTSRTLVNRLWEQLFGNGLVETLEDFGSQGALPSHPALLDWLSWQFMHSDHWSIKTFLKRVVMSATYRQSSVLNDQLIKADPNNTWLARGPRVRLSAESIRDQALAVSGVLCTKMYGPGIMPYQPPGIWSSPYNGAQWVQSQGAEQYRRSVYIYWKRSAGYPSAITFDGPTRQVCVARRIRTNTPLQALTLLNDPAYLDLARHFAYRLEKEAGKDSRRQIAAGYRLATGHEISEAKLNSLQGLYNKALADFRSSPDRTCEMIGEMNEHNHPETAALVLVTNALLNLDEVVTKY